MENKRTMTDEPAMAPEIKFEITNNMFVVVCVFKGGLYIHVRKYLPLLEGEHLCLAQSPSEVVDLFFEDSYNSINNNLVNAIFVLDGDKPPAVSLDTIKEHFKEELKTKLGQHMDFVNNGELKVARAIVYLSPLFKSIA